MRLHLRLDSVDATHIHETLFIDGKNCGKLTFSHDEYQMFGAALILGAERMKGQLKVEIDPIAHDEEGRFKMP